MTPEESKKFLKDTINEVLDDRAKKAEEAAKKKAEEDAKNNPPKKGFLDALLGS